MSRESSPEMSPEIIYQIAASSGETKLLLHAQQPFFNSDPNAVSEADSQIRTVYTQLFKIARGEFGPDYHGVTQDIARAALPGLMVDVCNTGFMRSAKENGRDLEHAQSVIKKKTEIKI